MLIFTRVHACYFVDVKPQCFYSRVFTFQCLQTVTRRTNRRQLFYIRHGLIDIANSRLGAYDERNTTGILL